MPLVPTLFDHLVLFCQGIAGMLGGVSLWLWAMVLGLMVLFGGTLFKIFSKQMGKGADIARQSSGFMEAEMLTDSGSGASAGTGAHGSPNSSSTHAHKVHAKGHLFSYDGVDHGDEPYQEQLPPPLGILNEYLMLSGKIRLGAVSDNFMKALLFIKKTFQVKDALYQVPWYVIVGEPNAQAGDLFQYSGVNLPLGQPDFSPSHVTPPLKWWFLDHALFISPRCTYYPLDRGAERSASAHSTSYRYQSVVPTLVQLLKRYRTARPLNGIMVALSCDRLYGMTDQNSDHVHDLITKLSQDVLHIQREVGLNLPVYVTITNMHHMPGFKDFCARLPSFRRNDMLGWSNPHGLDTPYHESIVDDAFQKISATLHHLRLAMFASHGDPSQNDGIFVFPREFDTLRQSVGLVLNTLFAPSAYNQGLLFRGLYFTGDGAPSSFLNTENDHDVAIPLAQGDGLFATGTGGHLSHDFKNHDGGQSFDPAITLVHDHTGFPAEQSTKSLKDHVSKAFSLHGFTKSDAKTLQKRSFKHIFFAQSLITQKITFEGGLATPSSSYWRRYRHLSILKTVLVAFFILSSFGLFKALSDFMQSRNMLRPVLSNMKTVLAEVHALEDKGISPYLSGDGKGVNLFAVHTRQVIDMMIQMEQTDLFSIFVPPSWFSSLDKGLKQSLKVAFRDVIIRSIANGMAMKAASIVHLKPSKKSRTTNFSYLIQPTQSQEFKLLMYYIDELNQLLDHMIIMHNLKQTGEPSHLRALIAYTFKGDLPHDFWKHYSVFRNTLRSSDVRPLSLDELRKVARQTLGLLYQDFLSALFLKSQSYSLPAKLSLLINMLRDDKPLVPLHLNDLRLLSHDFVQVVDSLQGEGQTWFDQPFFNPGPAMTHFFDAVLQNRLFGKPVVQFLVDQSAKGFKALQKDLMGLYGDLYPMIAPQNQGTSASVALDKTPPSRILFLLRHTLGSLFQQDFMQKIDPLPFVVTVPFGKFLRWDTPSMTMAFGLAQRFDDFQTKIMPTLPLCFKGKMQQLAQQGLFDALKGTISQAQRFDDIPDGNDTAAMNRFIDDQAKILKDQTQGFIKVLSFLLSQPQDHFGLDVQHLMHESGLWLLMACEKRLHQANPFSLKSFDFHWWDGTFNSAIEGFAVKDNKDLDLYVQSQIQHIRAIALEDAAPCVFLLTHPMMHLKKRHPVIDRWKVIVDQMEAYDQKIPSNTVTTLEQFITKTMNGLDVKGTLSVISIKEVQTESLDFFTETVRQMKRGMRSRAEVLQRGRSIDAVRFLTNYFNTHLQGKFPFVTSYADALQEADPDHIRTFFAHYNAFGGNAARILDQLYQLGGKIKPMVDFFQKLDAIKEFFGPFLVDNSHIFIPTFDFTVHFRLNRSHEQGGNLIGGWIFKPNVTSKIEKNDPQKSGQWVYGNDVSFQFRWPSGDTIPATPTIDPKQPELSVNDRIAMFDYKGPWALLWLLREHEAPASERDSKIPDHAILLKFVIPTGPLQNTILYNALTLTTPSLNAKIPGKRVRFPNFPAMAPTLDGNCMGLGAFPVLTEGKIKESSLPDPSQDPNPPFRPMPVQTQKTPPSTPIVSDSDTAPSQGLMPSSAKETAPPAPQPQPQPPAASGPLKTDQVDSLPLLHPDQPEETEPHNDRVLDPHSIPPSFEPSAEDTMDDAASQTAHGVSDAVDQLSQGNIQGAKQTLRGTMDEISSDVLNAYTPRSPQP